MIQNIKKRNKSLNKYPNTQIPKNSILANYHSNNEYDNFKFTVSNITKQLNNMSLSVFSKTNNNNNIINSTLKEDIIENLKNKPKEKIKDKINILPNKNIERIENIEENNNKTYFKLPNNTLNKERLIIYNNNSFSILGIISKNNKILNNEFEIKQENLNLKENIKFLLNQVKKYQKSGMSIDEFNKNINDDKNDIINKLNNIIDEKEKEIENIRKNYQIEIKSVLEKISILEIQYQNLKKKYDELKNKKNNEIDNKENYYNNDIDKGNNSEILENINKNINLEFNQKQHLFRNKKMNILDSNIENSKNTEDNYSNKKIEKRYTFHRAHHTTDFTNNLKINNTSFKKNVDNKNKFINFNNLTKQKYLKIINDKNFSLSNTFTDEKEKNNYQIIKNENVPKTAKSNNISFLYKKIPIKTEIISNNLNSKINNSNYKPSFVKSASHNYLDINQKTNYQNFHNFYKIKFGREENINQNLIHKLSSTLYKKKQKKYNFKNQDNIVYNNSYNNIKIFDKYYNTKEDEFRNNNMIIPTPSLSFSSARLSKAEQQNKLQEFIPLPIIDLSPVDLYYFPIFNNYNNIKSNIIFKFNIDNMKYSIIEYLLEKNSTFNIFYSNSINHSNDILLSITNGFLIITGDTTNNFYYYNKNTNYIYELSNLNYSHNKGALLKINHEQILCISGINSVGVEMYYIKDNIWLNLPKMNYSHSESSYMIYNNKIIFSFFGYDYDNNKYINDVEFLVLKNYYSEEFWSEIKINSNSNNLNYNLRNHSIFYRTNKENNNSKDIFIVGGYNDYGRNNGLIQVFIEENKKNNYEFVINFKKYEENKIKVKGNNNISLDKYNSMDNIFLFTNEFNQFLDEENNLFYSYNHDNNFNIHIIDNFTLKHTIYRNKLKNNK